MFEYIHSISDVLSMHMVLTTLAISVPFCNEILITIFMKTHIFAILLL